MVGAAAWNRNYFLMGVLSGAVLVAVASDLPEPVRDAFGPLEWRSGIRLSSPVGTTYS